KFFSCFRYILIFLFFYISFQGFPEGSKQIWIDNHETNLYLCNDFINQCNNGNGDRTQFAIYDCEPADRLYVVTASNNETVYLGFQGSGTGFNNHIVYRIKDTAGNIVRAEEDLPTSGTGYINNINEARVGPTQLFGAGGYSAISFHPSTPGAYYIEFNRVQNSTGNTSIGSFNMDLFDITVADTVADEEKPGRVFCKAWQFRESGGDNCSATFYVYSTDSIITSLALNNMSGGVWVTFCNQYGCANTANFVEDRKSLNNQQAFVPQFNIFLNPPDSNLFPAATTLGQIIPPVTGERFCDNGNILFHVTVDKAGNVVIELDFDPPYVTRTLATAVVGGENLINWDGLDGTTPVGVPVPNNVNISFTVSYINGLTNLPLYDVEGNNNGFTIGLVSPPGTTPLVFWDDSNIPGGTTNFIGCLSPPGCHPWPDGNLHTMNTWWYNVSTSTTPVNITQYRNPQLMVFNQSPPQSYCAGTNSVMFSVVPDPNTDTLHWNYTGAGATIIDTDPTDAFIMVNFSASATSGNIEVYGTNDNCTDPGPTSYLAITIKPIPSVNAPFFKSICSGTSTNFPLSSTPAGAGFSWNSLPPTCTPNITTCPPGTSGSLINDLLNITDLNTGTVTYHVLPTLNSCNGAVQDIVISVDPLPDVLINSTTPSICSGETTNILLTSTVPSTVFNRTATASSPNLSGYSPTGTGDILETISNSGFTTETITYSIMPTVNGCTPVSPTNYIVTVYPIPDVIITSTTPSICSGETTDILLSSSVTGTTLNWTAIASSPNLSGYSPTGSGDILETITNPGSTTEWVTYQVIPTMNGCSPANPTTYIVTVYPIPDLTITSTTPSICSGETTDILLTSSVTGTTFPWTASASSPNITGFSLSGSGDIFDTISNSGFTTEWVTYQVTPTANGCFPASVTNFTVTIYPLPDVLINSTTPTICSGQTTDILVSSSVSGTVMNWTATGSSPNLSGFSPSGIGDILETITNSGFTTEWVTYQVTPTANGCAPAIPTDYTVTIYPLPDLIISSTTPNICSGQTTDILFSSSVAGATFNWTAAASSPNLSGYSDGSGDFIAQSIVNGGATIEWVTYHVTPTANGCSPGSYTEYTVTVYPLPDVVINSTTPSICSGQTTDIQLSSSVSGTTLNWTATASSTNITGFSPSGSGSVFETLVNSGTTIEGVTYQVTPTANGCSPATPTPYTVTIFPVSDVIFVPNGETLCSGQITGLSLQSNVTNTSFVWMATGSAPEVTGYANGSGDLIQQTLYNSGYMPGWATYQVAPTANGCPGTPNSAIITVNPLPVVSFTVCFDTLTTTQAQPFALKGAIPPGGIFSGTGLTGSTFYPAIAGAGVHHIRYTYTNDFICIDSASLTIHIVDPTSHICGDTFTDLRDSLRYPTVDINGQCWMAANLNFGSTIASSQMQRNNCINEKYCYNDNPTNCVSYGGLYQWDEMMRYASGNGAQGFCPPGWHIPTETDWNTLFNVYISSGFAGNALKVTGYSGFDALLTGIRFHNNIWKFSGTDPILRSVLFWSSTIHAPQKAWAHGMNEVVTDIEYTPSVSFYPALMSNAFAIRCLKD
ncbi:MAG: hypothetical protein HQ542_04470, partial [Bacteroidia bacterium]|nr:hypothetical protein [Bacteroidia bacterium]